MKKLIAIATTAIFLGMPSVANSIEPEQKYIVQIKNNQDSAVLRHLNSMGETPIADIDRSVDALVVSISKTEATALSRNSAVQFITPDTAVSVFDSQLGAGWNLDRIDQASPELDGKYSYDANAGSGVRIYIVDTGVAANHPEFEGRVLPGVDLLNQNQTGLDCNGHGTHVAGIAASKTYGVAKKATIVPVRVLDCNGTGLASNTILAVDWIVKNHPVGTPAVVNLSLGGSKNLAVDAAVASLSSYGISAVVAAGNSNTDACNISPANVPQAITVGATDKNDQKASFSNYGSCLDIFAPGVEISSANIKDVAYPAVKSGTSQAAPHVAGVVATILANNPTYSPDQTVSELNRIASVGVVKNSMSNISNLLRSVAPSSGGVVVVPEPSPEPEAPNQPTNLQIGTDSTGALRLTWTPPSRTYGLPVFYEVETLKDSVWSEYGTTVFERISLTGLVLNQTYTFRVVSKNSVGRGLASNPITYTYTGLSVINNVSVAEITSKSARVSWNPVSSVVDYTINVGSASGKTLGIVRYSYKTTETSYLISDLYRMSEYWVQIIPNTTNNLGVSSPKVDFNTLGSSPSEPRAPIVSSDFRLSWFAPADDGGYPSDTTYIIQKQVGTGWVETARTKELSLLVDNPGSGVRIGYRIVAQNPMGLSNPSTIRYVTGTAVVSMPPAQTPAPSDSPTVVQPPVVVPDGPVWVTQKSAGSSMAIVEWAKVNGASYYRVQKSENGGAWTSAGLSLSQSYTTVLWTGRSYEIRVLAYFKNKSPETVGTTKYIGTK